MNRCEDFEILISAAMDGELDASERITLETHVDQCLDCRSLYKRMNQVNDWLIADEFDEPLILDSGGVDAFSARCESTPVDAGFARPDHSNSHKKTIVETGGRVPVSIGSSKHGNDQTNVRTGQRTNGHSHRNGLLTAGGILAITAASLAALLNAPAVESAESIPDSMTGVSEKIEQAVLLNQQSWQLQMTRTKALAKEYRLLTLMARNAESSPEQRQLIAEKLKEFERRIIELNDHSFLPPGP